MNLLIDKNFTFSYEELIAEFSTKNSYQKFLNGKSLKEFFTDFTFAILNGFPVELVDEQVSGKIPLEIVTVNSPKAIQSFEELQTLLLASNSEVVLYTSGTTGQPKRIIHQLKNLARNVKISEDFRNDVWGFAYNPTHMAGIQVFLQALYNGSSIINVFEKPKSEVFDSFERFGVTHLSATPTFFRLLFPATETFPKVRRLSIGGEKSNAQLIGNITKLFPNAKINNIYASTEAGSLFTSNGDTFSVPEKNKSWIKFVEDELFIHKDQLGYSESMVLDGDFYATGDLVEWIDQEKTKFRFLSRKNEMINVGGYKVNPSEVEEIIEKNPAVQEVLIFGRENPILGNILCAEIVLQKDIVLTEADLRAFLKKELINYKIPRKIIFVEELTTTRTGKKSRKK